MRRKLQIQEMIKNMPIYSAGGILRRVFFVALGALIAALGYTLFQVPYKIAAGGISGLSIILNHYLHWNEGTVYLLFNIPLLWVGFYYLGRWRFLIYTLTAVLSFSFGVNAFLHWLPQLLDKTPITNDMLLSALYAGIVYGLGNGIAHKFGGTLGGTGILGRIVQKKTGFPLSQSYLYTDSTIILISGILFGWEIALHAMLTLFITGLASDFVIEGTSFVRMAIIVTNKPEEVSQALMIGLRQGVSQWEVKGSFTGTQRYMVYSIVYRSQVSEVKKLIAEVDENAFVVIANAHQALGGGFLSLAKALKNDEG